MSRHRDRRSLNSWQAAGISASSCNTSQRFQTHTTLPRHWLVRNGTCQFLEFIELQSWPKWRGPSIRACQFSRSRFEHLIIEDGKTNILVFKPRGRALLKFRCSTTISDWPFAFHVYWARISSVTSARSLDVVQFPLPQPFENSH